MRHPDQNSVELPPIPSKRYFTIGEASALCQVKSHVLRYWEKEFAQLSPAKRRGNRRYYQRHDVELIRQIRDLLYDQGFTIEGARQKLANDLLEKDSVTEKIPANALLNEVQQELEEVLLLLQDDQRPTE